MYHLLSETSIFVALPNDSFCQLVGTPITELKPHTVGFISDKTTAPESCKHQTTKRPADEARRITKKRRVETIPSTTSAPDCISNTNVTCASGPPNSNKSVPCCRFLPYYGWD